MRLCSPLSRFGQDWFIENRHSLSISLYVSLYHLIDVLSVATLTFFLLICCIPKVFLPFSGLRSFWYLTFGLCVISLALDFLVYRMLLRFPSPMMRFNKLGWIIPYKLGMGLQFCLGCLLIIYGFALVNSSMISIPKGILYLWFILCFARLLVSPLKASSVHFPLNIFLVSSEEYLPDRLKEKKGIQRELKNLPDEMKSLCNELNFKLSAYRFDSD